MKLLAGDLVRDLRADLELADASTPLPWIAGKGKGVWGNGRLSETGEGVLWQPVCDLQPGPNANFIAQSRAGWPAAIRRALWAESEAERLQSVVMDAMRFMSQLEEEVKELRAEVSRLRGE